MIEEDPQYESLLNNVNQITIQRILSSKSPSHPKIIVFVRTNEAAGLYLSMNTGIGITRGTLAILKPTTSIVIVSLKEKQPTIQIHQFQPSKPLVTTS